MRRMINKLDNDLTIDMVHPSAKKMRSNYAFFRSSRAIFNFCLGSINSILQPMAMHFNSKNQQKDEGFKRIKTSITANNATKFNSKHKI